MSTTVSGTFTGTLGADAIGPTGPTGPPGSGGSPSPPILVFPTTLTFTDAAANVWGINATQQVTMNAVADTSTSGVVRLTYVTGVIWQENSANLWWGKASATAAWLPAGGTSTSPLVSGPTGPTGPIGPTGPGGSGFSLSAKTANYTLQLSDTNTVITMSGANLVLTIPANSTVPFAVPTLVTVINASTTPLSVSIVTDNLRLAATTLSGTRSIAAYGEGNFLKYAMTSWLASGPGVT
jgi:hypothetical protein